MASGVEELLDMLFDMVDEAKNVPLSSDKCMIERDRALDLIDDIRAQFPVELTEAKKVMATRADMLSSAKREAEAIRKAAEDKARQMVSEDVITLQAKQRANEMMQQAEERSRELKRRWPRPTMRSRSPVPASALLREPLLPPVPAVPGRCMMRLRTWIEPLDEKPVGDSPCGLFSFARK